MTNNLLTALRKRGVDGWKNVAERRGPGKRQWRLVKETPDAKTIV